MNNDPKKHIDAVQALLNAGAPDEDVLAAFWNGIREYATAEAKQSLCRIFPAIKSAKSTVKSEDVDASMRKYKSRLSVTVITAEDGSRALSVVPVAQGEAA